MMSEGFALLDAYNVDFSPLVVVPTKFGKVGELDGVEEDWNGEVDAVRRSREPAAVS